MSIDQAMILCAGLGTRLRPLTDELPKPLVPIGDRPILAHIVAQLRAASLTRVVVNAFHLPDAIENAAAELGLAATRETTILGTAGGVRHARPLLEDGPLVVVNGDILADLDVAELLGQHVSHPSLATLAVSGSFPAGSGTVGLDDEGRVVRLRGERFGIETRGADFVGAQVLSEEGRARLPPEGCLVGDIYLPALRRGERIATTHAVRRFWDVGTPESYLACNLAWLSDRGTSGWSSAPLPRGVTLARSVLGANTEVRGEGALTEVVAWPGAVVQAPLARAIVTPRTLLRLGNL